MNIQLKCRWRVDDDLYLLRVSRWSMGFTLTYEVVLGHWITENDRLTGNDFNVQSAQLCWSDCYFNYDREMWWWSPVIDQYNQDDFQMRFESLWSPANRNVEALAPKCTQSGNFFRFSRLRLRRQGRCWLQSAPLNV